ncbi:MAG: metal ABC transporter substrate-binding protein [Anaerolineae bacterium]
MPRRLNLILSLCVVFSLASCGSAPARSDGITVIATETFLTDIAQNVAGDRLTVGTLLPEGVDPHAYEPTPADVTKVAAADIVIVNGAGFEVYLDELLRNAGGEHNVVEASAGLVSRQPATGEQPEVSDADIAASICTRAGGERLPATAGAAAENAPVLSAEEGAFAVGLTQSQGAYDGFVRYHTDEAGAFQIAASGSGEVTVTDAGGVTVAAERAVPLSCSGLAQAGIVTLEADADYTIALTGFEAAEATLVVGPLAGLHQHEGDPHFWLDPTKVVTYVENIRLGLTAADPEGAAVYEANAKAYSEQLVALDAWIQEQVQQIPPERRLLVTNHESLGYFADRYGFRVVGTIVPSVSTEASPSAQQLAALIDVIRSSGAPAIFLETGTNPQLAEQVARETGVKVVTGLYTHSIGGADGGAATYLEMMRYNTNAIVGALK